MEEVVTAQEMRNFLGNLELIPSSYRGEVAKRYRLPQGGEVGLITSVTEPFCGDCTRARLSTEGLLVTCLFAAGGKDLKGPMRSGASDTELLELMTGIWSSRKDRYSELRAFQAGQDSSATVDRDSAARTTGAPIPDGIKNLRRKKSKIEKNNKFSYWKERKDLGPESASFKNQF